jgi:IS6 family transposase
MKHVPRSRAWSAPRSAFAGFRFPAEVIVVAVRWFARHSPGHRWFVDESYVKVNGVWRYVYRAIDQHGQVIDVLLTARRDAAAARRFFTRALRTLKVTRSEVLTDAAPVYPAVLDELVPAAWHHVEQYATDEIVKVGWRRRAYRGGVPAGRECAGGVGRQAAVTVW